MALTEKISNCDLGIKYFLFKKIYRDNTAAIVALCKTNAGLYKDI